MMIKATNSSIDSIKAFLVRDRFYNFYIIGDIDNYGLESKTVDVWADYRDEDINFVLMRYLNSYVISTYKYSIETEAVYEILTSNSVPRCISGCESSVYSIASLFNRCELKGEKLMVLQGDCLNLRLEQVNNENYNRVKVLSVEECNRIQSVYMDNDIFAEKYSGNSGYARIKEIFDNGTYYGIQKENDNNLMGVACISADSSTLGVLDAVAVRGKSMRGGYRNRVDLRSLQRGVCKRKAIYIDILRFADCGTSVQESWVS